MEAPPAAKRPLELSTAGDRPETTGASPSPSPTGSSTSSSGKRRHPSSAAPPFRSPPPPLKPWPVETLFRILCPAERASFVIGKGGAVVRQLREETGARIRMEDAVPGSEDRVFIIIADAHHKTRAEGGGADTALEELSPAQRALIKVFELILRVEEQGKGGGGGGGDGGGRGEEKEMLSSVVCRLLAPSTQVGCILGKGGKIIEKIRQETGAQVRILGRDYVPTCASIGDEMIQISGSFSVVKKALLSVSSCLQDNPRTETGNFAMSKAFGATSRGPGSHAQMDPYAQRGYLPSMHVPEYNSRGHSNPAIDIGMPPQRNIPEEEVVFRMLCTNDKVGSIIGKAGVIIRALQNETGSTIKILDSALDSDERIILIASRETPEMRHSPAQDAVIRVHSRLSEVGVDKGSAVSARLLVPAQQIGCLLGKGGTIIAEMRRATGASIRIFVKDQVPNCAQPNDEVVQVSGSLQSVHDALLQITGRIRETIFLLRGYPGSGMSHYNTTEMFRSGHELNHPGRYSTTNVPHGADHPIGLNDALDRPPISHTVEHLGIDQARFSYGNDVMGAHPMHDLPSPRPWAPEVISTGNVQGLPNMGNNRDCRSGMMESGNQIPVTTSNSIEVVVPHQYLEYVYGDNGSNLADIKELSGASIAINNPKPGEAAGQVLISGASDQIRNAQSLLHAFILCGMDNK